MYHAHFHLREEPFGVTPDPRFFQRTPQHDEALATLFCAIEQRRGFALLVGPPGLGKSSVLFALVQMLQGKARVAYLANPCYDAATIMESIFLRFGLQPAESTAASHRLFYQFLLKIHQAGETCVVILDEAQDLDRDTLEAIRMLSNFETPGAKLLQIVLAGQPALQETLQRPDCEQIRQRLNTVTRMHPLTREGVRSYMAHRLEASGGSLSIFTPAAVDAIAAVSAGVPRNVNTLSYNALAIAFALNRPQVTGAHVAEAARDLGLTTQRVPAAESFGEPNLLLAQVPPTSRAAWIAAGVGLILVVSAIMQFHPWH